jgi:hypothetical protein
MVSGPHGEELVPAQVAGFAVHYYGEGPGRLAVTLEGLFKVRGDPGRAVYCRLAAAETDEHALSLERAALLQVKAAVHPGYRQPAGSADSTSGAGTSGEGERAAKKNRL